MERVRVPNEATYLPFSLLDVAMASPLVSRLVLGATLPGRLAQAVAMGAYAACALEDWVARLGVRKIQFLRTYGADVRNLPTMPREAREAEVLRLAERIEEVFVARRIPREELARKVDAQLTDYIASVTGQRVESSTEVRGLTLAGVLFPFALGACDVFTGDVALFRDTGVLEPHVVAHEFAHRKGYWKELEAQVLAYMALSSSEDPVLLQAALLERLHRGLRVLAGDEKGNFARRVEQLRLPNEVRAALIGLHPPAGPLAAGLETLLRTAYEQRMRITGQNGLTDYDEGFTAFLWALEMDPEGPRPVPAGRVWS